MVKHITTVTTTGYGGTGSSVITDLLSEFNGVTSLGSTEYWFCQKPHGLSDLEFKLNDGRHRSYVAIAIENFTKVMSEDKELLNLLGKQHLEIILEDFISSLIDVHFRKKMSFEELGYVRGTYYYNIKPKFFQIISKVLGNIDEERCYRVPEKHRRYSRFDRIRFYKSARTLTRNIFTENIDDSIKIVAVDQLVPVNNIDRYIPFFDNLVTYVIDRDPRDLFLLNKLRWKGANYLCNTDDVVEFVDWFRATREDVNRSLDKKTYFYNFEDFVYNYDRTVKEVVSNLNLSNLDHVYKKKIFDPEKSKQNTLLYQRSEALAYSTDLKLIEEKLTSYLWNQVG